MQTSIVVRGLWASCAFIAASGSSWAQVQYIDLVNDHYGFVDNASSGSRGIIFDYSGGGSGTGNFDPFLRVQLNGNDGWEQGVNTDISAGKMPPWETKPGGWTKDITLADFASQRTTFNGQDYFVLALDINENMGSESYISLDSVRIFTSPNRITDASGFSQDFLNDPLTTAPNSSTTLRWSLDANMNNQVLMTVAKDKGSGTAGMYLYLPTSTVENIAANEWVYLYTRFGTQSPLGGTNYAVGDGFEEWGIPVKGGILPVVPEPHEYGMIGVGGLLALMYVQRRMKKKTAAA
jgi:hypothetical protein